MRIVVALGGNALLQRGEALTAANQRENIRIAAAALAPLADEHELIISHGNGPQVGLLALQGAAYKPEEAFPLDVLGAETEGMIGYMIEQELRNRLSPEKPVATILTMVEVEPDDPASDNPTKFVGPVYTVMEAEYLAREKGWVMKRDGENFRRVVPSPAPRRIAEIAPIRWLLEKSAIVICAGGGGIPVTRSPDGLFVGVEAVIDKDAASALLARNLDPALPVMRAIGVREIAAWLRGDYSREEMIEMGQRATRNYAKRQYTWLRHQPPQSWPRVESAQDALAALG